MEEERATSYAQKLRDLLDEYETAVRQARARKTPGSGLLGFGPKRGDYPCHEAFDQKLEALFAAMAAGDPPVEDAADAIGLLLRAEEDRPWPEEARWMLVAAQRHALPVIPLLPGAQRRKLLLEYRKRYPRFRRLPVQDQVLKALARDEL